MKHITIMTKREVDDLLTGYATNTLHIASNTVERSEDGTYVLTWTPPPDAPVRQSRFARLRAWRPWSTVALEGAAT